MRASRDPNWLSCAEIAALKLRGMPHTREGMSHRAERSGWFAVEAEGVLWRARQGRGGGCEVNVRVLPAGQRALARRAVAGTRLALIEAHLATLRTAIEMLQEEQAALLTLAQGGDDA